jgi:hypothetical protein
MPVSTPIPMTVLVRGESVRFTSTLTNAEAAQVCRGLTSDFARKLVQQLDSRRSLSPVQTAWLHKLAIDSTAPRPAGVSANLSGVVALLDVAGEKLKFPKITVEVNGQTIVLSRCSPRSQYAGCVNVAGEGDYQSRPWFGRIDRTGNLIAGRAITDSIREALRTLSADPVGFAREYGRRTGRCCFCNAALRDERSTEHGYGPVCAKSYGLPWSTGSARQTAAQHDQDARRTTEALATPVDPREAEIGAERLLVAAGGDPAAAQEIAGRHIRTAREHDDRSAMAFYNAVAGVIYQIASDARAEYSAAGSN